MGYNSVLVVMNDALDMIRNDPEFGERVYQSTLSVRDREDVSAHSNNGGIFCNAATVISSAHADEPQVMVVKHNTGWVYRYGKTLPDSVLEDLAFVLEQHGYRISRKKKAQEKLDVSL